jgi:hypothetical protein
VVAMSENKKPNYDLLARAHILSIKKGILPEGDDLPDDFGKWDQTINQIEKLFRKSNRNVEKINDIIDDMAKVDKALAKLIAPKPKKQPEVKPEDEPICPPLPDKFDYLKPLAAIACKWVDDCVAFLHKWSPRG